MAADFCFTVDLDRDVNIRDPEKLQRYNELGRAFMERWEREHPE